MKKTYEAPELIISGNVIRDTLMGLEDASETQDPIVNRNKFPGVVGYYL